jgi:hypothetical protein
VEVEMNPGSDFGGAAVEVEAAPGTQFYSINEDDGTVDPGMTPNYVYLFLSEVGDGERSRFLILRRSNDIVPAEPFRARLFFRTTDAVPHGATFRIVSAEGGSWTQGHATSVEITQASSAVAPYKVPAPRVFPAQPNPFHSGTDILFELDSPRHVTVRVYSATGRLVRSLLDATVADKYGRVSWNGRDDHGREMSSGIYFVKVSIPEAESTIRIVRLK